MKISVIITTYNNPFYLEKVLYGLRNQKRSPDELIVADDGSGKDTAKVIKTFSETVPFPVMHVWQENKGFRAAKIRNKAINRSSGEYIIFLDGDCIVNRHFISDHIYLAERNSFIQGKRILVKKKAVGFFNCEHANSIRNLFDLALHGKISNIHHLIRFPYDLHIHNRKLKGIKSCNMSFFKSDLLAVNAFNEDFIGWGNEDSELACRFFIYGLRKKIHPFMAICFHLWHPANYPVNNKNKELLKATIAAKESFCQNGLLKTGINTYESRETHE